MGECGRAAKLDCSAHKVNGDAEFWPSIAADDNPIADGDSTPREEATIDFER
jgi:hypothetical protein